MIKKFLFFVFVAVICCSAIYSIPSGSEVPEWILSDDCEDFDPDYYYAYGSAKYKSLKNSMKAAKLNAKAELARQIGESINAFTSDFSEEAGEMDDTQALQMFQDYQSSIVKDQKLEDVKQVDFWKDTDGTVYILVRMPKAVIEKQVQEIVDKVKDSKEFKKSAGAAEAEKRVDALVDKYFSGHSTAEEEK